MRENVSKSPQNMAPADTTPLRQIREKLRRSLGAFVVDSGFRGLSRIGGMLPNAKPARHGVEVLRDIPYQPSGSPAHLLDIYRPARVPPPYPVVFYVHGGGFRILSKDSHWLMGLSFARRGFLVFNINYRLAPRHPYPAALQDACRALTWTARHAAHYGGDTGRLVLAGESAGANLVTSLALACCYPRPEPFASEVFRQNIIPRAVIAACGLLQVSDPGRFARRRPLPQFLTDRIEEVSLSYLPDPALSSPGGSELADPLLVLEKGHPPARPLPPFFAPVGTKDPILDDTRRLKAALERLGSICEARYYPGEIHAFHALLWRPQARQCWRDTFSFLQEHL